MEVYETKNRIRIFLFRKETRYLYWNRILSDKMKDFHSDHVFFFFNERAERVGRVGRAMQVNSIN